MSTWEKYNCNVYKSITVHDILLGGTQGRYPLLHLYLSSLSCFSDWPLGGTGDSLLSEVSIEGCLVVKSVEDETSSGYNREMERFVLPVEVRMLADQMILSLPLFTDSTTASFQLTLFVSSTTSPTLTCWSLLPVVLCVSLSAVRYSFLQRFQKWSTRRACLFALHWRAESSLLPNLGSSSWVIG